MFDPSLAPVLGAAALAGLAGTPHCIGMCGGLAVGASRSPAQGAAYLMGKATTYGVLGGLAGSAPGLVQASEPVVLGFAAVFLVWFSLRIAGVGGVGEWSPRWLGTLGGRLLRRSSIVGRFAFGMSTGLLPCGLVYAALALAVTTGTAWGGALAMVTFGLATVPALAATAFGARKIAWRGQWSRRVMAVAVLVLGLGALGMRASMPAPTAADPEPSCHEDM